MVRQAHRVRLGHRGQRARRVRAARREFRDRPGQQVPKGLQVPQAVRFLMPRSPKAIKLCRYRGTCGHLLGRSHCRTRARISSVDTSSSIQSRPKGRRRLEPVGFQRQRPMMAPHRLRASAVRLHRFRPAGPVAFRWTDRTRFESSHHSPSTFSVRQLPSSLRERRTNSKRQSDN